MPDTVLIIGAGYLGRVVARRLLAQGVAVRLTTRSEASARAASQLLGVPCARLDLADPASSAQLAAFAEGASAALFLLPPSGCVDAAGSLQPLEKACAALTAVECAVLSSSTAVYGDHAGAVVSAETPCLPRGPREERLQAIEDCWLARPQHKLVRLAGLYGPGRVIGQSGLLAGMPVAGDPDGWLNLLHIEDAAALVLRSLASQGATVELGCDGRPVARRAYYGHLAACLGLPAPRFSGEPGMRGGGSRRCDSGSTRRRTGWVPMFADFRAGLAQALPPDAPYSTMNCP